MIWFDRACCNAREFLLRIKHRMINVWIARDPSKTTRLVLFSVSGVSLFVLSLVLYPENPLDFNDSGIFSSVFGRNPRWLLNRELGPLQPTLLSTTFACAAAFAKVRLGANLKPLSNFMHGVLGLPMGFMLVFRWNNAHERWWYGRTCLGNILFYCKNLGGTFCTWVAPDDPILAARALALISTLKECVADRLNGTFITDASIVQKMTTPLDSDDLEGLFGASNKVLFCLEALRGCVQEAFRRGYMPPAIASTVHAEVASIMDNYGSCEKVVNQPPPGCIITHLKCTLMVYVCSLPFILVHEVGVFGVVPVTTLLSFALFGIEAAAEQIEQPFGNRPYDLPVRALMRDNSRDLDQTSKRVLGFTGFVNGKRETDLLDKVLVDKGSSQPLVLFNEQSEDIQVQERLNLSEMKENSHFKTSEDVEDNFEEERSAGQSKMKATSRDWRDSSSIAASSIGSRANSSTNVLYGENLISATLGGNSLTEEAQQFGGYEVGSATTLSPVNLSGSSGVKDNSFLMIVKKPTDWKKITESCMDDNLISVTSSPSRASGGVKCPAAAAASFQDITQKKSRTLPTWKAQDPIEIMDQLGQKSIPESPRYHTSKIQRLNSNGVRVNSGNIDQYSSLRRNNLENGSGDDRYFSGDQANRSSTPYPQIIRSSPEGEIDIRDIPHRDFGPFLKRRGRLLNENYNLIGKDNENVAREKVPPVVNVKDIEAQKK